MKHTTILAQLRPLTPDLDLAWSATTLAAITEPADPRPTQRELDLAASPLGGHRPGSRLRRPVLLVAAAAVAASIVGSSTYFGADDAVAADLRDLSAAALNYDDPVVEQGSWLHERSESLQRNDPHLNDGAVLDTHRETWTGWDGRILLIEQRPSQGWTTYDVLDDNTTGSYQDPTPAFAQTLPEDAADLRGYLDPLVFGSSSHPEALFEALTSLVSSHTLPPTTLAAAYEALADVEHVQTSDVEVNGRPAIEITYTENSTSSTESITVDRATGQSLSTSQRSLQSTYTSTTTLSEVVDSVPADVRATFKDRELDVRYDAAGQPIDS